MQFLINLYAKVAPFVKFTVGRALQKSMSRSSPKRLLYGKSVEEKASTKVLTFKTWKQTKEEIEKANTSQKNYQ